MASAVGGRTRPPGAVTPEANVEKRTCGTFYVGGSVKPALAMVAGDNYAICTALKKSKNRYGLRGPEGWQMHLQRRAAKTRIK